MASTTPLRRIRTVALIFFQRTARETVVRLALSVPTCWIRNSLPHHLHRAPIVEMASVLQELSMFD